MACSLKPSRVAPVGDAFAQYKKTYGEEEWMKLFMKAEDDHHSSVKGSYLAACIHSRMIFGEPCSGNYLESLGHPRSLEHMGKSTDFLMKVLKSCKKLLMRLLELRIKE